MVRLEFNGATYAEVRGQLAGVFTDAELLDALRERYRPRGYAVNIEDATKPAPVDAAIAPPHMAMSCVTHPGVTRQDVVDALDAYTMDHGRDAAMNIMDRVCGTVSLKKIADDRLPMLLEALQ